MKNLRLPARTTLACLLILLAAAGYAAAGGVAGHTSISGIAGHASTSGAPAHALVSATPDIAAQVDTLLADWESDDKPGLVVAVIRDGEIIHQKG